MIRLIVVLCCASLLSGCFFFGDSSSLYGGYGQRAGMYLASSDVDNSCISPRLRSTLNTFEQHYGRKIVLNSGYRDPIRNIIAGGKESSYHMRCMAADFFIPGVSKQELIAYAKRNGAVGGLGCYPGHNYIHVDVRDRPRGARQPVLFSGC